MTNYIMYIYIYFFFRNDLTAHDAAIFSILKYVNIIHIFVIIYNINVTAKQNGMLFTKIVALFAFRDVAVGFRCPVEWICLVPVKQTIRNDISAN